MKKQKDDLELHHSRRNIGTPIAGLRKTQPKKLHKKLKRKQQKKYNSINEGFVRENISQSWPVIVKVYHNFENVQKGYLGRNQIKKTVLGIKLL